MTERSDCTRGECEALIDRFLRAVSEIPREVRTELESRSGSPGREAVELLGRCLWDVFSDNHEVLDSGGRLYDLGSFRASGGFIANRMEIRYPELGRFGYLDFYMGNWRGNGPPAVYRWIFLELREAGCDWIYVFPRLHLLRIGDEPADERGFLGYDPSEALADELEARDLDRATEALVASLERAHEESVRDSRHRPLPATVVAYREVFGRLPKGWSHRDM